MKLTILIACISVFTLLFAFCDNTTVGNSSTNNSELISDSLKIADSIERKKISEKAVEALAFCKSRGYNTEYCLLINMGIHSGLTRFFVWDLEINKPIDSGLVSHGCGTNMWGNDDTKTSPVFSNEFESHCSSLGKYKIGARGYSNWGIHVNYAMHGLDSTNNNSFDRQVCMHSWEMVDDIETYPDGTPEGWGCAAVSNAFMKRLDDRLRSADQPVLMWIFN